MKKPKTPLDHLVRALAMYEAHRQFAALRDQEDPEKPRRVFEDMAISPSETTTIELVPSTLETVQYRGR